MDPINPWLDPSEVRHLAEQLLRPVVSNQFETADPGFNPTFVGFVEASDAPDTPDTPDTQSDALSAPEKPDPVAEAEPVQSVVPQATNPPPTQPVTTPRTHFLERIQIFRDWLAKNFPATDIFILDHEGKVIFDESGHGRLHFIARNLAIAAHESSNVHVKMGPSTILEVIPCETPLGRIVLGALVPQSLSPGHVQTIGAALIQTASPE